MRFLAGAFALSATEKKLTDVRSDLEKWRTLSPATDYGHGERAATYGQLERGHQSILARAQA